VFGPRRNVSTQRIHHSSTASQSIWRCRQRLHVSLRRYELKIQTPFFANNSTHDIQTCTVIGTASSKQLHWVSVTQCEVHGRRDSQLIPTLNGVTGNHRRDTGCSLTCPNISIVYPHTRVPRNRQPVSYNLSKLEGTARFCSHACGMRAWYQSILLTYKLIR